LVLNILPLKYKFVFLITGLLFVSGVEEIGSNKDDTKKISLLLSLNSLYLLRHTYGLYEQLYLEFVEYEYFLIRTPEYRAGNLPDRPE
jgi:hypothetical protein